MALHEIDTHIAQPVEVFLVFDLLSDDLEFHRTRELDHGGDHLLVDKIGLQVACVRPIDLQIINGQVFEAREGTQAATEIVQ